MGNEESRLDWPALAVCGPRDLVYAAARFLPRCGPRQTCGKGRWRSILYPAEIGSSGWKGDIRSPIDYDAS